MAQNDQREKIEHDYFDFSAFTKEQIKDYASRRNLQAVDEAESPFPSKLHYMLSQVVADDQGDIVSWQPHGRCFLVKDRKRFTEKLLPLWFRQTKYHSFQRQLNIHGFKRITRGHDKEAYYHPLFLRGKLFLTYYIRRQKINGMKVRKPTSPETEPNFYDLPPLPPSPPPNTCSQATVPPILSDPRSLQTLLTQDMSIGSASAGQIRAFPSIVNQQHQERFKTESGTQSVFLEPSALAWPPLSQFASHSLNADLLASRNVPNAQGVPYYGMGGVTNSPFNAHSISLMSGSNQYGANPLQYYTVPSTLQWPNSGIMPQHAPGLQLQLQNRPNSSSMFSSLSQLGQPVPFLQSLQRSASAPSLFMEHIPVGAPAIESEQKSQDMGNDSSKASSNNILDP